MGSFKTSNFPRTDLSLSKIQKMAKPKMIFVIFLATAALIQAFPQAGDSEKQETFDAMDVKDGDGLLTKKEFQKGAKAQDGFDETIENIADEWIKAWWVAMHRSFVDEIPKKR